MSAGAVVLVTYLAVVLGFGFWFARKSATTDEFMSAGRSLPGWAVGLSMFGSYISSISFLANPGKAYSSNWNAFVFSLAAPLAAWVAVRWFMPFFRSTGEVSAYEHLERRFGRWAHLGVFARLEGVLGHLSLSAERERLLRLACQRAASLKARAGR